MSRYLTGNTYLLNHCFSHRKLLIIHPRFYFIDSLPLISMSEIFNRDYAAMVAHDIKHTVREHGMNPDKIRDGVILGSGLGSFADTYMNADSAGNPSGPVSIPFNRILENTLHVPPTSGGVAGHKKELLIGPIDNSDNLVIAQNGREHPYEGIDLDRATFWLRVMQVLGVKTMIGSNASGILTPKTLTPPALMLVSADQDYTGQNPLIGENDEWLGPRFPHMADLYPAATRSIIKKIAQKNGIDLKEGLYIRMSGPNYERPEDVYKLRSAVESIWKQGSKQPGETRFSSKPVATVGMSSTYENMVMQHASQARPEHRAFDEGRAYISVATNYSASLGPNGFVAPSDHKEVQENAQIVQERFGKLVRDTILEFMGNRK